MFFKNKQILSPIKNKIKQIILNLQLDQELLSTMQIVKI